MVKVLALVVKPESRWATHAWRVIRACPCGAVPSRARRNLQSLSTDATPARVGEVHESFEDEPSISNEHGDRFLVVL